MSEGQLDRGKRTHEALQPLSTSVLPGFRCDRFCCGARFRAGRREVESPLSSLAVLGDEPVVTRVRSYAAILFTFNGTHASHVHISFLLSII